MKKILIKESELLSVIKKIISEEINTNQQTTPNNIVLAGGVGMQKIVIGKIKSGTKITNNNNILSVDIYTTENLYSKQNLPNKNKILLTPMNIKKTLYYNCQDNEMMVKGKEYENYIDMEYYDYQFLQNFFRKNFCKK